MKPTLYVNFEGPLLIPGGDEDPVLQAEIAPYARTFLLWAISRFHVVLLSERPFTEAVYFLKKLGIPLDKVPVRSFDLTKTELFHAGDDFFWVDDIFIPSEIAYLQKHDRVDRAISVDPRVGVTEQHKQRLEAALSGRKDR